ncbi:MAG: DUF2934 domain-containing protein [Mesorhizobium sp.]
MSGNRDERIRERAHAIWDREGKPEGAAQRHWQQAEGEIDKEDKAPKKPVAPKKAATKKPAAAKKPAATSASASRKTAGAGPALAKRSKDAKKPTKA